MLSMTMYVHYAIIYIFLKEGVINMGENIENCKTLFIRASEVAKELEVSNATAYKIVKELNNELKNKGFLTISGRVSREYFESKIYKKIDYK